MALERKNIEKLTDLELETYTHAVKCVMNDPDPTRNYRYHADLHNRMAENPPHGCEHYSELFLPWHRFLLYNFEQALRASDPHHPRLSTANVTIPFWDWTATPQRGDRYPHPFEDPASVLFHPERTAVKSAPFYTDDQITDVVKRKDTWRLFAGGPKGARSFPGALEQPFHDFMHKGFLGSPMNDPKRAAEDPIFWSFHAYIDRIWERWTRVHGLAPTSLGPILRGFPTAPTVEAVVDIERLGYCYIFEPDEVRPIRHAPGDLGTTTTLAGAGRTRSYTVPPLSTPPTRAYLWLTQLIRPAGRSFLIDVLIHPPGLSVSREDAHAYHVGQFVLWQVHHELPGEKVGIFVDITAGVARESATARELTLVARPFDEDGGDAGGAGTHPGHHHAPRAADVSFGDVLLQLEGGLPPDVPLGTAAAPAVVARTTRFELHIRPMFRLLDRDEMLFKFDVWSYDEVKANADAIVRVLQAGTMPPTSTGGPWPREWIELFERWVSEGYPRLERGSVRHGGYTARRSGSTVTLMAKGRVPGDEFGIWLEADCVTGTERRYTLMLEPPAAPVGHEKPFTVIARFEAPSTLTVVSVTDADGTHDVPIT